MLWAIDRNNPQLEASLLGQIRRTFLSLRVMVLVDSNWELSGLTTVNPQLEKVELLAIYIWQALLSAKSEVCKHEFNEIMHIMIHLENYIYQFSDKSLLK